MSSCRQRPGDLGLAVIVLLNVCLTGFAQQTPARGGRPILFSEPKSDLVSSNLNAMGGRNSLNRLDEDLKKPFDLLDSENVTESLHPRMQPQLPPPKVNSKKVRELIEKQHNWIYLDPNELDELSKKAEEMFKEDQYDASGLPKKKLSPLESFWLRMDRQQATATNDVRKSDALSTDDEKKDDNNLSGIFSRKSDDGKSGDGGLGAFKFADPASGGSYFADPSKPRDFSTYFSSPTPPTLENAEAREARMQEFKAILDPRGAAASPVKNDFFDSFARPAPVTTPSSGLFNSLGSTPASAPTFSSPFSSDSLRPAGLPGISPSASSLAPATTPVYQQRPSLPPPTLQMPRRSF